jgi:uncharacterized protein (DUF2267 family)
MDYAGLVNTIERDTGLPRDGAEQAVRATLDTLDERRAEVFEVEEFMVRVARREGVVVATAQRHARAVLRALDDDAADAASDLPAAYRALMAGGDEEPATPAGDFFRTVAQRAGIDVQAARRVTIAVLEMLGERISGGEVDDLADLLPSELAEALDRGNRRSNGAARPLSLKQFLGGVAEHAGITPEEAREQARAVLATLREHVGEKELADMRAQLPDEYRAILAHPDDF